jgi:hypothetical protein
MYTPDVGAALTGALGGVLFAGAITGACAVLVGAAGVVALEESAGSDECPQAESSRTDSHERIKTRKVMWGHGCG